MGEKTGISWTDHTFNPWWGCVRVSPGCNPCYAEADSKRYGHAVWGPGSPRRFFGDKHWNEPLKWNAKAQSEQKTKRVFCASMADVFEENSLIPELDKTRGRLWKLIKVTPWLNWLLLTKRPENFLTMLPWDREPWQNCWLGVSVENADYVGRVDTLRETPAKVRFISYEPALGPIHNEISLWDIDWLIAGGQSGVDYKVDDDFWYRSIYEKCTSKGVAFFFKQHAGRVSGMRPYLYGKTIQEFPCQTNSLK